MLNAVTEIEAARRGFEFVLKRHLEDRHEDHAYLVKVGNGHTAYVAMDLHKAEHDVAPENLLRTQREYIPSVIYTKFHTIDFTVRKHVDCPVAGR
jgi:hypothetical protein